MENTPNLLDLIFLIILVFFLVKALMRGFVRELAGLVGAVIAVVVSAMFYQDLGAVLERLSGVQATWWPAVAFALILLVVFAVFLWMGAMIRRLLLGGGLSGLDRLLGAGVGLVKGALICYLLVNLLLLANPFSTVAPLRTSVIAPYVVATGRYMMDLVPSDLTRKLQERAGLLGPGDAPAKPQEKTKQ
ncbi:MAG: CvpA family protein [Desulfarculaceae bacterium]|nr:CvpA family protein [Desulfarculaceae bacterium]MCF8073537.1 CvpA family protein [Desulfarculaceae bacterium]MCF8103059.1 CvpA family protein [Desulfarculaceae bacterium]MCF8115747.1 CvpA family protein [Desulfarculaceae bacterium]